MIIYKNSTTPINLTKGTGVSGLGPRTISGLITTFNNPDHVNDVIHPNALDRHFAEYGYRLPMLSGHSVDHMIGWHDLQLVSNVGVRSTSTFLEGIARADEDLIRVKSGGMAYSIGFMVNKEEWRRDQRWLTDITLFEASIVLLPCNPKAVIEQRHDPNLERDMRRLMMTVRGLGDDRKHRQARMTPAEIALDNLETTFSNLIRNAGDR